MRRVTTTVTSGVAAVLAALAVPAIAHATPHASGTCNSDWYVNPDETNLKPKQTPRGMLFDGPSIIHHAPGATYTLSTAPEHVSISGHLYKGVPPLFKYETTSPYSTINRAAGGWWSSKIASGPGSQDNPLPHIRDFVGLWQYTQATTILSFGAGYANDTGNTYLLRTVRVGRHVYRLACRLPRRSPSPTPTPSSSPTGTPSPSPTSTAGAPGEAPVPTPVRTDLPVTG